MSIVYQYSGPNLRGAKKEMRKAIDAALTNHRQRFLPRHFDRGAFARYPLQYQQINVGGRRQAAIRAAAIKRRFDETPAEQWAELRVAIQNEFDRRRANPNRLLPLVDTGALYNNVMFSAPKFQGSLNARKMVLTVPVWINSPTGIADKRAALQVIRQDEIQIFAKIADRKIQQFANTKTQKS